MKHFLFVVAGVFNACVMFAQSAPLPVDTSRNVPEKKAHSLLDAFEQGHFNGHFRSFFMATDNDRRLSDYYAWAAGGTLHFNSAPWHGFQVGLGGLFNFNLMSSDLAAKDSLTGALNRYEIGLFDVQNPKNRSNLDRVEELWLRYQWKNSRVTLGHQALQTPFINDQDGRMSPTAESGVWAVFNELKKTRIEGGFLWKITPRGTVEWFSIGESIGLYPKGLNPDGTGSGYPENLESKGIGILGITRHWGKNTKLQAWDQYVDNIFNTVFAQVDHAQPLDNGHRLLLGFQLTHQDALAHGGNAEAAKSYFQKGGKSNVISAQAGWQYGQWQALAAYTRIGADGRFLSPREWGREPFYTFMSRERTEGSGDVHSFTVRTNWQGRHKKLRLEAAYGHFYLPDIKNTTLNKYAFPAFRQFNLDVRYVFEGALEGLRVHFLYVWKGRIGDVYGNDKYRINRVDMSHYNLIFNYTY